MKYNGVSTSIFTAILGNSESHNHAGINLPEGSVMPTTDFSDHILISIRNPGDHEDLHELYGKFKKVLVLRFWDSCTNMDNSIEQYHVRLLMALLPSLQKGKAVIHCEVGSSRTATVAMWIEKQLGLIDNYDDHPIHTHFSYNVNELLLGRLKLVGRMLKP